MRTVVVQPPPELQAWLERRRALGQDKYDEVWEGEYHVAPGPTGPHGLLDHQVHLILGPRARAVGLLGSGPLNIGEPNNYRVPDHAYLRQRTSRTYTPTAAIIVEIISPGDESWAKLGFYFDAGVEELLIVDPVERGVHCLRRGATGFEPAEGSTLLGITAEELSAELDWPPV